MRFTKEELQKQFIGRDDDFWCIKHHFGFEGDYFVNNGFMSTQCTGYAKEIVRILGPVARVVGFLSEDNPNALVAHMHTGHDFALVEERFIVDPWIVDVETGSISPPGNKPIINLNGQGVFDMENSEDQELIELLYGDKTKWADIR